MPVLPKLIFQCSPQLRLMLTANRLPLLKIENKLKLLILYYIWGIIILSLKFLYPRVFILGVSAVFYGTLLTRRKNALITYG